VDIFQQLETLLDLPISIKTFRKSSLSILQSRRSSARMPRSCVFN